MVRRPPPRKKKIQKREPEQKPVYEPKTIIMFGKAGAVALVEQLEQVRADIPYEENRFKWDSTPLGKLLRTMKSGA